jgi:hypothetical protein
VRGEFRSMGREPERAGLRNGPRLKNNERRNLCRIILKAKKRTMKFMAWEY